MLIGVSYAADVAEADPGDSDSGHDGVNYKRFWAMAVRALEVWRGCNEDVKGQNEAGIFVGISWGSSFSAGRSPRV